MKFNNCTFNSDLIINLKDAKVQFNNCTFNGISYLNNGQLNSEFNCPLFKYDISLNVQLLN